MRRRCRASGVPPELLFDWSQVETANCGGTPIPHRDGRRESEKIGSLINQSLRTVGSRKNRRIKKLISRALSTPSAVSGDRSKDFTSVFQKNMLICAHPASARGA